ncbi:MAG: hypothetical protein RBU30_03020, partial [Polyangia bacterium]|nr:hypothetical protein [Polyangia bacterium]
LQVGQKELRQTVGALSDNVGFGLEELASIVLPGVLAKEAGVTVKGGFVRRFVQTKLGEEELDLFSEGDRGGEAVAIVGEVKSRIYEADARRFAAKAARVAEALEATLGPLPLVSILFGFVVHPSAQQAAKDLDLLLVASRPG